MAVRRVWLCTGGWDSRPGPRQRGGQPLRGDVLVHVARLELDDVHIAGLPDAREVLGAQHGPLAQVRPQVVDEHAADHVLLRWPRRQVGEPSFTGSIDWIAKLLRRSGFTTRSRGPRNRCVPAKAGIVRIYSCGPTVYRYVHVGNLRTFMLPDLLCQGARVPRLPNRAGHEHHRCRPPHRRHVRSRRGQDARVRAPGEEVARGDRGLLHGGVHARRRERQHQAARRTIHAPATTSRR